MDSRSLGKQAGLSLGFDDRASTLQCFFQTALRRDCCDVRQKALRLPSSARRKALVA